MNVIETFAGMLLKNEKSIKVLKMLDLLLTVRFGKILSKNMVCNYI